MVDPGGWLKRVPTRDSIITVLDRVPATHGAVSPFIAGDTVASVVAAVAEVVSDGTSAAVAHLPRPQAQATYLLVLLQAIEALDSADLADGCDLMVDLAALGLARQVAPDAVRADLLALCAAAEGVGMTVMLDGLAYKHLDDGLSIHASVIGHHPDLGVTIAANLLRSEADCTDYGRPEAGRPEAGRPELGRAGHSRAGTRVRLVRQEPVHTPGLAFTGGHEVDRSYVRCARSLIAAGARTVIATHDPRLIEIASALAVRSDREPGHVTFQFRMGVQPQARAELLAGGASVSVLVPFGPDWAAYMARRIAGRPSALRSAARSALSR